MTDPSSRETREPLVPTGGFFHNPSCARSVLTDLRLISIAVVAGSEPDAARRVSVAAGHWAADSPAEKTSYDERHDDDRGCYGEKQGWADLHGETLNDIGNVSTGSSGTQ